MEFKFFSVVEPNGWGVNIVFILSCTLLNLYWWALFSRLCKVFKRLVEWTGITSWDSNNWPVVVSSLIGIKSLPCLTVEQLEVDFQEISVLVGGNCYFYNLTVAEVSIVCIFFYTTYLLNTNQFLSILIFILVMSRTTCISCPSSVISTRSTEDFRLSLSKSVLNIRK